MKRARSGSYHDHFKRYTRNVPPYRRQSHFEWGWSSNDELVSQPTAAKCGVNGSRGCIQTPAIAQMLPVPGGRWQPASRIRFPDGENLQ